MSTASLSRSGYSAHRSPAALAGAIALNGGVVALLIAIPAAKVIIDRVPSTPTHWIYLKPPPAPIEDQRKPEPKVNQTQKPVDTHTPTHDPFIPEPLVPLGGGTSLHGTDFVTPTVATDAGQKDPPHVPALISARPDPRFAASFRPDYPTGLRREGLEGSVTVRVTIDERGRVIAVEMVKATDPAFYEETKRQALRSWRFLPATRDGVAVRTEQTMTVHFRLED